MQSLTVPWNVSPKYYIAKSWHGAEKMTRHIPQAQPVNLFFSMALYICCVDMMNDDKSWWGPCFISIISAWFLCDSPSLIPQLSPAKLPSASFSIFGVVGPFRQKAKQSSAAEVVTHLKVQTPNAIWPKVANQMIYWSLLSTEKCMITMFNFM